MTRKRHDSDNSTPTPDPVRQAGHNPRGAARRRLLRAVGKSGGLAIGGLLAANWIKPVVRSVLLPAHAQTSPGGCPIGVTATLIPSGPYAYSMAVLVSDTVLVTASGVSGVSTVAAGSSIFPPNTYFAAVSVQQAENQFIFGSISGSCCDVTASTQTINNSGTDLYAALLVNIADDGECFVAIPE